MKKAAIVMIALVLAAVCGIGYLFMTSYVAVEAVGVVATEAATQPDTFALLKEEMAGACVPGTTFRQIELDDPANYQFFTYTVRLRNASRLVADMVELQVTPREGDVLQMAATGSRALGAGATGDVTATILTESTSSAVRELTVTYYIWGIPFTVRTTYGG